jgi:hypothetical protein
MEHLISNTIWPFIVFLVFMLGVIALAKTLSGIAKTQKRCVRLQRREGVEALLSEPPRVWRRPMRHASTHGKEYTP